MNTTETARSVIRVVRQRDITLMAAGVTHYALASFVPLLILVLAVSTYVGGEGVVDALLQRLGAVLSQSGQELLRRALSGNAGRAGASVVSLLVALWSGIKVFRGLSVAFSEVYGERGSPSLLEQVRDGVLVVTLVVLAFGSMVGIGLAVRYVELPFGYQRLVGTFVIFLTLLVTFLPIYYVLPPVSVSVREVLPGTAFAAVGWILLQVGFLVYTQQAGKYAAYGFLGAVLLFITWLYFGAIIVLLGGIVNAVRNHRTTV